MTRVGVFHPGAQNSWQRALAAQEAGALAWYLSSVQVRVDGRAMRLAKELPGGLGRRLERATSAGAAARPSIPRRCAGRV
ncbi:MAG: hypothetical protein U5L06_03480 [Rhodovibrio sp.]|nr:hypothetical protein [Rhodovibrio sp.]